MGNALDIKVDTSGLNAALDSLTSGVNEYIRPAAQAGAQVFYNEVRQRVPVSAKGHWFHGTSFKLNGKKYWFNAGALRDSIYQVYSKDNSTDKRATYHISWNFRKVPYGFMVENGTSHSAAHPFIRPSYDAVNRNALEVANVKFNEGAKKVIAGLKA